MLNGNVKVFNKGKSRNTLTVCSSLLPLHPASEIQAVSSSKIRWVKPEKIKEKFGSKKSALIFAPRFWKSELKRRGLRRKKEVCWKKNLVLKILLLSLRPGSEKVNERDRVWEEKMKSVERKIWCEKSSSYLCSPLKKWAKSSSNKNDYQAENFWKILEEKFGRNKKALTFATPIKREAK